MEKITREQVAVLVGRIRNGEGDDSQLSEWISKISAATAHPQIIKMIMSGNSATVEEIVEKLYNYQPIVLAVPGDNKG